MSAGPMPRRLAAVRLDLDDISAQVGQQQRTVRHVINLAQFEDRHTVEHGSRHGEVVYGA